MRFFLLILFVSSVLTEEQTVKNADKKSEDKKELKKTFDEPKSKTGKRDSSDHTGSFGVSSNDEPFKPMTNSPAPFVAAASANQQVYYDKNQVTAGEGVGNAKIVTNPQATNAYRAQYTQVAHQQQQNKNNLRVNAKNVAIQQPQQQQQQNQPNILYAVPPNPTYHYERIPQQQQQIQLQGPSPPPPSPVQHGQQKQIQYLIAIPVTYLRQLQQQLIHQQQQEQPSQVFKGQYQQQQQQQQPIPVPVYSIAGPLARDNHGSYRPFHRFSPTAVNDASTSAQHQTSSSSSIPQPLVPAAPAPPGYVTQYVQIPASTLLAAIQSAQVQQQRPVHLPQQLYQQQPQAQVQPIQLQQPHAQTQSPQLYYYQPQQQQVQLKQSQPSHALTSPPVYAFHVNQAQQPSQQHQTFQHLTEQQQVNAGKETHRILGVRPTGNLTPTQQYDSTIQAYESEEKAQLATLQAPAHTNIHAPIHTNAYNQQYIAQAPLARQQQQTTQTHPFAQAQAQTPEPYERVVHYQPQYAQHYQEQSQNQPQHQHQQRQPHRLQIQPHQHSPFVEHLNNLPFSQGIHGPTSLPYLRLPAAAGEASLYNLNIAPAHPISQPFISGGFQPSFTPLGMPSKVTSFTNVLLQPFGGHPSSYHTPEIGTTVADGAETLPYLHSNGGGIRYGTHLYHPPTSATTAVTANKQHNAASHTDPRILTAIGETKISAPSEKAVGNPTIVKYP